MKIDHSLAILIASATLLACAAANAAVDPAKSVDKMGAAASFPQGAAPLLLPRNQALPKKVEQLIIIDREPGDKNAKAVEKDSAVLVHYTGWLYDPAKADGKGDKIDASRDQRVPVPFGFFLNAGRVIKGWDLGLVGMKPNGKRTLIIPASLAYGEKTSAKIPANSTLIFDIELMDIVGKREAAGEPAAAPSAAVQASAAPATSAATTSTPTTAPTPAPTPPTPPTRLSVADSLPVNPTALMFIDQVVGDGATAENGAFVQVHYTGWLYDAALPGGKSTQFDSSRNRGQAFKFKLGGGRVIKGWDQGVVGMKVKGKRTLIIPPEFGYGARGASNVIPPNATLIFDVELIDAPPPAP